MKRLGFSSCSSVSNNSKEQFWTSGVVSCASGRAAQLIRWGMIVNEWSVRIAAGHDILVNGRFDPEAEASPNLGDRQDQLLHNFLLGTRQ